MLGLLGHLIIMCGLFIPSNLIISFRDEAKAVAVRAIMHTQEGKKPRSSPNLAYSLRNLIPQFWTQCASPIITPTSLSVK